MKRCQICGALFLLGFGGFICWESLKLDYGRINQPGPGFFPFWLGLALIIISSSIAIQYVRIEIIPSTSSHQLWKDIAWGKVLCCVGALLVYAFVLERVGYIITTFLFLLFLFLAIGHQKWFIVIFGSAIFSFITYTFFKLWLGVQLPRGVLGM